MYNQRASQLVGTTSVANDDEETIAVLHWGKDHCETIVICVRLSGEDTKMSVSHIL